MSWTQQKRFKSLGEFDGGATQVINKMYKKKHVVTSAGKHTMVRYFSNKQMTHYSDLSKKRYLIFQYGKTNKEQENAGKNSMSVTLEGKSECRQCSYCQSILEDGNDQNIRTCKNMLMRGKLPYTKYEKVEYTLLHIKDYSAESLSNDQNIFAYEEENVDSKRLLINQNQKLLQ